MKKRRVQEKKGAQHLPIKNVKKEREVNFYIAMAFFNIFY